MQDIILDAVQRFGYLMIYMLLSTGIFGFALPDEPTLLFAGSLASYGHLSFTGCLITGILGSVSGSSLSYWVGRRYGKRVLYSSAKKLKFSMQKVRRGERWLRRYGAWAVLFSFFLPGLRQPSCYLAGTSRLPFITFVLFNTIGSILWVWIFVSLGLWLGERWGAMASKLQQYGEGFLWLAAAILLVYLVRYLHKKRTL